MDAPLGHILAYDVTPPRQYMSYAGIGWSLANISIFNDIRVTISTHLDIHNYPDSIVHSIARLCRKFSQRDNKYKIGVTTRAAGRKSCKTSLSHRLALCGLSIPDSR